MPTPTLAPARCTAPYARSLAALGAALVAAACGPMETAPSPDGASARPDARAAADTGALPDTGAPSPDALVPPPDGASPAPDAAAVPDGGTCARAPTMPARAFHVAPGGAASGDGSAARPWDLATALAQPAAVHPGDTIWLHGGTYRGAFHTALRGTADAPIVVRQYPGERATIDGGNTNGNGIFVVSGAYAWYQDFEVMSSDPTRTTSSSGSWPTGTEIPRGEGVQIEQSSATGAGIKFIALRIHDARQGISFWSNATDAEAHACVVYNNGWTAPDRGHGHGFYAQNRAPSTMTISNNVIFGNYSHGIQAYGSSAAYLDNFHVLDNALVLNADRHLLVGGGMPARDPVVRGNMLYRAAVQNASDFDIGYDAGLCSNATVADNYVATSAWISCAVSTMTNNTFLGPVTDATAAMYPGNVFSSARPSRNVVFAHPNRYEPGRGHVVVYNWEGRSEVAVDISSFGLCPGETYEVRSALDPYGTARTGTYSGPTVTIAMNGWSVAAPIGDASHAGAPPGPAFGVFLVGRP